MQKLTYIDSNLHTKSTGDLLPLEVNLSIIDHFLTP